MAIAGRVAIVPKGDWSANATYKRLDAVTYNNTLYFAKKEVPAGTETSNAEYWSKSIVGNPDKSSDQQGQNLITYPYYSKSNTINGITWTVNDDGTVTANGTATKESAFNVVNPYGVKDRKTLELNQKYVLSDGTSDKAKTYTQFVRFNASTNTYDYAISSRAGYNTWTASDKNLLSYGIRLIVANGATVNNVTFKPMLEIGTVSHEYQPTTLSNPTLKEQIGSALQPESIVNNQTTTKAGFALDARQANPNIDGTLAKQVADLNGSLEMQGEKGCTLVNATGMASYIRNGFMAQVIMEITPTKLENGAILLKGLPRPQKFIYMTLPAINGNNIPCVINANGELSIYYQDGGNSISRIDHIFCYMCI